MDVIVAYMRKLSILNNRKPVVTANYSPVFFSYLWGPLDLIPDNCLCKYECLFIAYNAAEPWGSGIGHLATLVFTIILSFLNVSDTLLVQLIFMIKAASACKLEGLQSYVYHMYAEHLLLSKADSWILLHTLLSNSSCLNIFIQHTYSQVTLMQTETCCRYTILYYYVE